ncbi:MAG: helix-turn-helix domain-containing protein [Cyanobacteria bacterium P01_F01_bin.150]
MAEIKVGRPREFDIDVVVDAAIEVFWSKGYDGASISDLTQALGITRPSLYAAFKDKRGLYLRAIERYISSEECPPLVEFEAETDIRKAVTAFMTASIDYATKKGDGMLGCFLSNCVSTNAGEIEGVQELLRRAIEETDKRLAKRFELEKANGNLPADFPSQAKAKLMFDLRQGIALRARAGISAPTMKSDVEQRVAMILA